MLHSKRIAAVGALALIALLAIGLALSMRQRAGSPEPAASEPVAVVDRVEEVVAVAPREVMVLEAQAERLQRPQEPRAGAGVSSGQAPPEEIRSSAGELPKAQARPTVDDLLASMDSAAIAFNAPTSLTIDETRQVQLLLGVGETVEELESALREEGERLGGEIQASRLMEARLTGRGFEILAITPEVQAVSKLQRTEWKWDVRAREGGPQALHLTLTALLEVDGQRTQRALRTFDRTIDVEVTLGQRLGGFLQGNWQWLWAAVLVPLAGWLWRRRRTSPAS